MDEVLIAAVAVGGTLLGSIVQWGLAALNDRRGRRHEREAEWGELILEMKVAGDAIVRESKSSGETQKPDYSGYRDRLDKSYQGVILRCPLELTRPATEFVRYPYMVLRGEQLSEKGDEGFDSASQRLDLVYRHLSGVNQELSYWKRGQRAQKSIAPEFRTK